MAARRPTHKPRTQRPTYDTVRELALLLPGVAESTSYGTPALKVRGALFVRLKEDGETIVLRSDSFDREHLLATAPDVFFITDHYRNYPWVLVRVAATTRAQLRELLEDAWRRVAPKALIAAHDKTGKPKA
ncbi:MAG TPA: MmcQ/YjbR family DNA-binding protein [Gemmatimonadaceae bacterium]